jgi:hypothetical protein
LNVLKDKEWGDNKWNAYQDKFKNMFKKWSGMNMELDRKQHQFDTYKKNHWKIIVAKDYGIQSKLLKVKHGDQIETTIIQGLV